MRSKKCGYVSERTLESFLMNLLPAQIAGRIYDDSIVQIEDHLIICAKCQDFGERHVRLVNALRAERNKAGLNTMASGQALSLYF